MTYNVGKATQGAGGKYDMQSVVNVIAKVGPDLVGVQELVRNDERLNCDDQPALLASKLSEATGRRWSYTYAQEWFTQNRVCVTQGRGDGPQTEGIALFAPEPINDVSQAALWNSRLVLAGRTTAAGGNAVAVTHLAANASNKPDRIRQIGTLVPWTASLGAPRWLVGDFNAPVGSDELGPVLDAYRDAWADAAQAGTIKGDPTGATHGTQRIDYIYYAPGTGAKVTSAEVVDTIALVGKVTSDHAPLVATFQVP